MSAGQMTDSFEWRGRVGAVWAEEWRRTDRAMKPLNAALVAEARALAPGRSPRILDIGCGAGATSLALAEGLDGATICGIDLSEALVGVARDRAGGQAGLQFETGDAASWAPQDGGAFDLLVSRHGVMFFADPVAAFAHLRSLASPGGALLFSCFRSRRDNEWALSPLAERFAPIPAEGPAGPFAFADPARVERILGAAGFGAIRVAPFDFDFLVGEGEGSAAAVAEALAYFRRIGPFASLLRELDEPRAAEAVEQLRALLAGHARDGAVALRAAAWIVTAAAR